MNREANWKFGAIIFAALAISGALMNSRPAIADTSKDVVVTPLPLPVAGTLAVTQSGSWTVGSRDSEARQPYLAQKSAPDIAAGNNCSPGGECQVHFPAIPAGKRLVIRYVSARYISGAGDKMYSASLLLPGGQIFLQAPYVVPPGPSLAATWTIASQAAHATVESGQTLTLESESNAYTAGDLLNVAVTGYLVDVP